MLGYSPISAIDRIIQPCAQYDKYFDKPKTGELKKKMLSNDADVDQTVNLMFDVINKHYKEVERAKHLVKGSNIHQTAKKIFDFIYNHIKYNLEPGEILHTPAAVYWHGQVMARQNPGKTQEYPIDCDDMAIMACSFLKSLHMPWALRIASYDGIKYGHVYCVIPGKQEIIIDPVYIAFNQEKPYKMQKTFIGSTEGMAGIPVYLQSVNGMSGLGQESIGLVNGLLSGNLSGIAENETIGLIKYLQTTKAIAEKNPKLVAKTYKKPYVFQQMLDRAINGLNENEESEILDILVEEENQFISEAKAISGFAADNDWYIDENPEDQELSGINYRTINGIRYFNVGNLGFFGRVKLLKKAQQKRTKKQQTKAVKGKKIINMSARAVKMLNKANPVIVPIVQKPFPVVQKPAPIVQKPFPVVQTPSIPVVEIPETENQEPISMEPERQDNYPSENFEPEESLEVIEPDEETDALIEGLADGLHFAGIGLGNIFNHNQAIKAYMNDTLKVLRKNPHMAKKQYKKPYMFQSMLEKAINGLNENEESDILEILAEQEKQILHQPLSGMDSDTIHIDGIGYISFGSLGYFGRLGLFKKLKDKVRTKKISKLEAKGNTAKLEKYKGKIAKRDANAASRNERIKTIARVFNKVNPVTVAARNGLRILISLNFIGVATKISSDPELRSKVQELFKKMGGEVGKLNKSIITGAKKAPLTKTTGNVKTVDGFGDLGAVVALSTIIAGAGKVVNKIIDWSKKRKEQKANANMPQPESSIVNDGTVQPVPMVEQEKPKLIKRLINKAKDKIKQSQQVQQPVVNEDNAIPEQETRTKSEAPKTNSYSKTKIAMWAAGIASAAALAYFATNRTKKQSSATISGYQRISGIKLK